MRSAKSTGRIIGALLLAQLAAGLMLPFIILRPWLIGSPQFLTTAAANSSWVRLALAIAFVGAALTVTLGVTMLPVLRRYSESTAFWFLCACVISCVLDVVHNATVMSMLSLSQAYMNGAGANQSMYELAGAAATATRKWAHMTQLLAIGGWILIFYSSLFRFRLIPRVLAALGVIAIASQFTGVTLMLFLGRSMIGEMAMPMLPVHLATGVWLLVKGFRISKEETTA